MDKLPEKGELVRLDLLRIEKNKELHCKCENPSYEIDVKNGQVQCVKCGAIQDPFNVLLKIAERHDKLNKTLEMRLEQKQQIDNYKPHLKIIKRLEEYYRRRPHPLPLCPACDEPFYLEELTTWTHQRLGDVKIAIRKERKAKELENHENR